MQQLWTIRDQEGVVHALPKNWAVRSWKTVCGVEPPTQQPEKEAPTCLMCVARWIT